MSAVSSKQRYMLVSTADVSASEARCSWKCRIRHDKSMLSLMLTFDKVTFNEFNSFLIILFFFVVYISPEGAEYKL